VGIFSPHVVMVNISPKKSDLKTTLPTGKGQTVIYDIKATYVDGGKGFPLMPKIIYLYCL